MKFWKTVMATSVMVAFVMPNAEAKIGSGSKNTKSASIGMQRDRTVAKIAARQYERPKLPEVRQPSKPVVIAQSTPMYTPSQPKVMTKTSPTYTPPLSSGHVSKDKYNRYESNDYRHDSSTGDVVTGVIAGMAIERAMNDKPQTSTSTPTTTTTVTPPLTVKTAPSQPRDLTWLWITLGVCALGASGVVGYNMYKRKMAEKQAMEDQAAKIMAQNKTVGNFEQQQQVRTSEETTILHNFGGDFYKEFQQAVENQDIEYLRQHSSKEMFDMLVQHLGGDKTVIDDVLIEDVYDIRYQGGEYHATVHFTGYFHYVADGTRETFDEAWHVARINNAWVVNGIQTL